MVNYLRRFVCIFLLIILPGCVHVISRDLRANADASLTFGQVHKNPELYKDKTVIWGGEIIETANQKDKTTLIEVFQRPLLLGEEPDTTGVSGGRFLVLSADYLDPYLFQKGRMVTVAGEISGEKTKLIGEMEYQYPLLSSKQIYLWPEYYYAPYPPNYYDPLWNYGPPWTYPYRWRPGPYYRYRR